MSQQEGQLQELCFHVPPRFQLGLSSGPCAGNTLAPKGFNFTVGRTKTSRIHIKDPSVSEKHAEVCWNGRSWLVRDLGSSNGTKLNGVRLQPFESRELCDGNELMFGSDSVGKVQLTPVDLSSCTIEQMLNCLHEALAQSLQTQAHDEAAALLKDWGAASAELRAA
ncbi:SMAD/FHA domain-containing protein [Dunaliella salina]|uniref:SMAD/FHA domain-containing protein n=1 Tax=Dunaliella salina TaxID=3046 RepID=A0ABQ7G3U7_DUNSA|nr:SMAD/FHA domain-containing protein [Dunaliella salina]|eukprot:KAF5829287.1 SMAD/FHA domain-containing protein [Dunaliella salina]